MRNPFSKTGLLEFDDWFSLLFFQSCPIPVAIDGHRFLNITLRDKKLHMRVRLMIRGRGQKMATFHKNLK